MTLIFFFNTLFFPRCTTRHVGSGMEPHWKVVLTTGQQGKSVQPDLKDLFLYWSIVDLQYYIQHDFKGYR